jgi:rhodanese-related sulfurtransferase
MLLASIFTLSACKEQNFTNISNEELQVMLDNKDDYQFIDVRTKDEYFEEHIRGFSTYIDFYILEDDYSILDVYDLDKDKPVVIMCNSGNRSVDASNIFFEEGFTEVYNLTDGIQGWTGETE